MSKFKLLTPTRCLNMAQIHAYLKEDLTEEERFEVENHLLDCPLCADAVEGFANMHNVDDVLPELDFLKESNLSTTVEKETTPTVPAKKAAISSEAKVRELPAYRKWGLRVAAGFALLAVLSVSFMTWQHYDTQQFLATSFTDKDTPIDFIRSGGNARSSAKQQLNAAIVEYQKELYPQSYQSFLNILETQPELTAANFYAGLAAAKMENWQEAETRLKRVRINDPDYYDYATWQLAGIYLQQNKAEDAKSLLSELARNPKSEYHQRAVEVLRRIL